MRKGILENIHETAKDFYEAGLMDETTMRKFDAHCLEPTKEMSKYDVKRIRAKTHVSQPVFASYLNVTAAAVKQWEKGERKPGGASARLLQLIDHNGLDVFASIQVVMQRKVAVRAPRKALATRKSYKGSLDIQDRRR
jgi:putative transcriptional regulator